jgi:hypothetical protein
MSRIGRVGRRAGSKRLPSSEDTNTQTQKHIHTHTHTLTHTHTQTYVRIDAQKERCTHAHKNTHDHMHKLDGMRKRRSEKNYDQAGCSIRLWPPKLPPGVYAPPK